jgi:hypothetical protein
VRLIVQRAPNFGNELAVQLSIDGIKVANIPRDQHYEGASSSGRHVLTVLALPNTEQRRPTSVSVEGAIWAHSHIHCEVGRESTGLATIENLGPDDSGAAGAMNVVELWAIATVKTL